MIPRAALALSLLTAVPAQAQEDLAAYQAEYNQLLAFTQNCQAQMNEFFTRQGPAAANGILLPPPPCQNQMPAVISRIAFLETRLYRARTGDYRTPSEILIPNLSRRPSSTGGGGAGDTAGRYDRGSIRGTWIYRSADGTEYELPQRPYYFRDRASGRFIGSDSPDPPADGRDYEVLEPAP